MFCAAHSGTDQRGSDLPGPPISCALECALGRQADGVPLTPRFERRPAALAARREARVSAAPSALTPAWKCIAVNVNAAMVPLAHTNVAAAAVAASALERVQVSIEASHRRKAAPRLRFLRDLLLSALSLKLLFQFLNAALNFLDGLLGLCNQ